MMEIKGGDQPLGNQLRLMSYILQSNVLNNIFHWYPDNEWLTFKHYFWRVKYTNTLQNETKTKAMDRPHYEGMIQLRPWQHPLISNHLLRWRIYLWDKWNIYPLYLTCKKSMIEVVNRKFEYDTPKCWETPWGCK